VVVVVVVVVVIIIIYGCSFDKETFPFLTSIFRGSFVATSSTKRTLNAARVKRKTASQNRQRCYMTCRQIFFPDVIRYNTNEECITGRLLLSLLSISFGSRHAGKQQTCRQTKPCSNSLHKTVCCESPAPNAYEWLLLSSCDVVNPISIHNLYPVSVSVN
jgi:hypothetical protein